jgi:hypothetical protein
VRREFRIPQANSQTYLVVLPTLLVSPNQRLLFGVFASLSSFFSVQRCKDSRRLSRAVSVDSWGAAPRPRPPLLHFASQRLFFVDLLQFLLPFLGVLFHSQWLQTLLHLERSTKQTCVSVDPPCPQECSRLETRGMGEQPLKRFRKNTNTGPVSCLTRPFPPVTVCSSAAAWVGLGPLGTLESSRGVEEAERDWGCGYRRTGFRRGCTRESGCRFTRFRRVVCFL